MSRVSSNSHVPVNKPSSSSKPQSTGHTSKPEQRQAEHSPSPNSGGSSSGGQQSESKQYDSGKQITGGVDSKTQFLATQNLRNKKPEVKAETSGSGTTKADGNIPDDQDENGLTAQQLNTTGSAAKVTTAEIDKAAGGDQDIEKLLTTLDTDVEGHKELRLALDKGTTYHKGPLAGNVVGLTETGSGHGPVVTLDSDGNSGLNIDTVAHETAHAAYQDMSHAEVYRLGHRVQDRVNKGQTRDSSADPATTPQSPVPQGTGNQSGGGGSTGGSGNAGGGSFGGAGNAGGSGESFNGGGSSGGVGGSGGGGGGPVNNTGINTTIAALPAAGNITDAQLSEIANGDPKVIAALKFMMKDPEGAKLIQLIIQKHGHIVDDESLSGGIVGEAPVGGNNPTVKIKEGSLNSVGDLAQTLFHEFTHVSGDPGDANHNSGNDGHDSVYNAQKAFAQRMGIRFAG